MSATHSQIASLPMYDWPEVSSATNDLWKALAGQLKTMGVDAPEELTRTENDEGLWLAPDLLLGQTCGYPFATVLKEKVQYVATPIYDVKGCQGSYYSSAIVARRDSDVTIESMKGASFAYNATLSLSGYRTIKAMVGDLGEYFSKLVESGGHRQSARLVAAGKADVAALDAVCWHLLQQHEAETAEQLKVIGWSALRPALPLITSLGTDETTLGILREVLNEVFSSPDLRKSCHVLAIKGCEIVDLDEYAKLSAL